MTKKKYHITRTDNGWQGKLEKGKRASVTGSTKKEVQDATIGIAKKSGNSQVFIHGTNGRIQEERTYPRSEDPCSSEG